MNFDREHTRLTELFNWQMDTFLLGLSAVYILSMVAHTDIISFVLVTALLGLYTLNGAIRACRTWREMKENRRLYGESRPQGLNVSELFNVEITFERKD